MSGQQLKSEAKRALAAIPGFRGLEIDDRELIVYVVSRADEALLPRTLCGLSVRAVVAEKLAEERRAYATKSGTFRIAKKCDDKTGTG
jgi:hypothetical protein